MGRKVSYAPWGDPWGNPNTAGLILERRIVLGGMPQAGKPRRSPMCSAVKRGKHKGTKKQTQLHTVGHGPERKNKKKKQPTWGPGLKKKQKKLGEGRGLAGRGGKKNKQN